MKNIIKLIITLKEKIYEVFGIKHSRTWYKVNKRWQPTRNPWPGSDEEY